MPDIEREFPDDKEKKEAMFELFKKARTRWNSEEAEWQIDGGYIDAVFEQKGNHISSKRWDKEEKQWVLRGDNTHGYVRRWESWDKPIPKWYKTGGMCYKRLVKSWSHADHLGDLHKDFHWIKVKDLTKMMKAAAEYLDSKGFTHPPLLKPEGKLLEHSEMQDLLTGGFIYIKGQEDITYVGKGRKVAIGMDQAEMEAYEEALEEQDREEAEAEYHMDDE